MDKFHIMLQLRFASFAIFAYILILHLSTIECRPRTQKIVIHGHEWTVPDEPGWEEVLQEAESIRHHSLTNCATTRDCRLAAERIRQVFLKHPVSSKYYDDSVGSNNLEEIGPSIFRWG